MQTLPNIGHKIRLALITGTALYLVICVLAALETYQGLHTLMVHFFVLLALLLIARQVSLLVSALQNFPRPLPVWPPPDEPEPFISILVPAYNEEAVISPALASLLRLHYENYEIILVDDGSSDNTLGVVRQLLATHNPRDIPVRIISHSNAGKANALNTGLMHAVGEFVLCVDSDARVSPASLVNGLRHFQNKKVGAVAGNVVVVNETNLLTRFQQLEYLISQNFTRRGLGLFGAVTIVPGPVGLFRKTALAQAAGYREDAQLFAEDADLSVRLLAHGWRINSEEGMQAFTEAPDEVFSMLRQRYRWKRGIYQVLHDNFFQLITAPGLRGPLLAVWLVVESFLFEVLGFGVTLFMIVNIISLAEVNLLLGWLAILLILDLMVLLLATPPSQFFKWLPLLLLQKITYSYALQVWGVLALFDEWRSSTMSWDKVTRLGALEQGGLS